MMRPFTNQWRQRRATAHRGRHAVRAFDATPRSILGAELQAIRVSQLSR